MHQLHVAADVVLVARVEQEVDESVGLGRGDALLAAIDKGVESLVDRRGDLLADAHRFVLMIDHQAQRPRFERHAAAQDSPTRSQRRVRIRIGRRVDQHRAFGHSKQVTLADLFAEHRQFGEPRGEQPAVTNARGFALGRHADFYVEPIALLDAGAQEGANQNHRRIAGGEHLVGTGHLAAVHFVQQGGPLRRRRRIGTGAG